MGSFTTRDGSARACVVALVSLIALSVFAVPASAQIISTSIPKAETAGAAEKTFAFHVMGSPFSKWHYNELVGGSWFDARNNSFFDVGLFSGTPSSDFLFAGETIVKVGKAFSVGGGGWYNKVGKVNYNFDVLSLPDNAGFTTDHVQGTLSGDLKLSEGHVNAFYKNVGAQVGFINTKSTLTGSKITADDKSPRNIGLPLGSIEASDQGDISVTDWDLYGVYKYAGKSAMPFGISVGAGVYDKRGNTESSQRSPDDQMVFSGFLTGTIDLYKGIGIDVSYWYIAKTEATIEGTTVSSKDPVSRFTIGFSYAFSK